jgi:hypothetical protein
LYWKKSPGLIKLAGDFLNGALNLDRGEGEMGGAGCGLTVFL